MDDLRAVLERKRREIHADPGAFDRLTRLRRRRHRNGRIATIMTVIVIVGATGLALRSLGGLHSSAPRSAGPIDASRTHVVRTLPLGRGIFAGVAAMRGDVWVGSNEIPGVIRLDVETGRIITRVQTHEAPEVGIAQHPLVSDLVAAFGSIWTVDPEFGTVSRIDPERNRVIATIPVGSDPTAIAEAAGSLWVVSGSNGTVGRIDPTTDSVIATVTFLGTTAERSDIVGDDDAVWFTAERQVVRIDPLTERVVDRIPVGRGTAAFAIADEGIWVANGSIRVSKVDPVLHAVVGYVSVGGAPVGVIASHGAIWVSDVRDGTVRIIDTRTNSVVLTLLAGRGASDMAVFGSSLWVLNEIDDTLTMIHIGR
jgi:DNA-binding beta-propeller fold protein YncE